MTYNWIAILAIFISAHSIAVCGTTGKLRGTVTNQDGFPVPNTRIWIENEYNNKDAKSNWKGRFEIIDLPQGNYNLTAEADGYYQILIENVRIWADTTYDIEVGMHRELSNHYSGFGFGKISGMVIDSQNNPLPGAIIHLRGVGEMDTSYFDGLFAIDSVFAGRYNLEISLVGYTKLTIIGMRVDPYARSGIMLRLFPLSVFENGKIILY